jgi:hypothetical protein
MDGGRLPGMLAAPARARKTVGDPGGVAETTP